MVLIWLGVVVVASYGLGRRLLRALSVSPPAGVEELAWSIPLGLGAAGMALFALGLAGALYRELILALTLLAAAFSVPEIERWLAGTRARSRPDQQPVCGEIESIAQGNRVRSGLVGLALSLAAIAVAAALVGALAPPTAGDAICYHLELPKVYLAQHHVTYLADSANSTYPLLMEMLFLWGLALDGAVLAQLLDWLVGLLLGLATFCLAAPMAGRTIAGLSAAIVLLVPGVTNQMTAPLNDLGVALYVTLTMAALVRGMGLLAASEPRAPASGAPVSIRWMALAGTYFGFALGVKYVALLLVPGLAVIGFAALLRDSRWSIKARGATAGLSGSVAGTVGQANRGTRPVSSDRTRSALRGALLMVVASVAVGGGWYLRTAVHTGNPVYPFLSGWFGSDAGEQSGPDKTPLPRTPAGLLASPWQITMHPERFGGRAAQLGVLFLALLPGLWWTRPAKPLAMVLGVALVYYIMWFMLRQNVRFLLPMVPALAVGAGWVLVRGLVDGDSAPLRLRRWSRGGVVAIVALLLGFNALIAVARARDTAAVALGLESTDAYLRRTEPSYAAARFARDCLASDAVILSQDYRSFYFQQRTVRENVFRRRTRYDEHVAPGTPAIAWLRQAGFTHALIFETESAAGLRHDQTLNRLLGPRLADLPCPLRYEFRDGDGVVKTYRLVELKPPPGTQQATIRSAAEDRPRPR